MKITQRGFVVPLLIIIVASLLIGGYVYMQNRQGTAPVTATSTAQTAKNDGVILLGDKALYQNLSSDQKAIVDAYNMHTVRGNDSTVRNTDPSQWPLDEQSSRCVLKYVDSTRVLIGCGSTKPQLPLSLIDRNTLSNIGDKNCSLDVDRGYIENNMYLITVSDGGVCYYKSGDSDLTFISGLAKNNTSETYIKLPGIIDSYDLSFDSPTKTLTVGVFKNIVNNTIDNPKIRTVQFVLH